MKKLIFITIILLLFSCEKKELKHKIIISKSYHTFSGDKMPDGICRYFYKVHKGFSWVEFQDKCNLYKVVDTIK